MSRARDLADIVSGGFDVPLASLDNVPASNDASALTTGTLPSARLPATLPARDGSALTNLSATNLTGVIPTANFPAFLPAVDGSALTNLSAANLTGSLPAISGANLTGISAGATIYDGIANLPTTADEGSSAFVKANNSFYVRGNGQWQTTTSLVGTQPVQQEFLPDSNVVSNGSDLGRRVHLSSDGQTAVAAAKSDDTTVSNGGSVIIYQKGSDGSFAYHQRVESSDIQTSDSFGGSVYLSDDGLYLAVGARGEDQLHNNAGAVYIFNRASTTANFAQQAKLVTSDGSFYDYFGTSVAFNADATYLVAGADGEYGNPYVGTAAGAAYIFTRSGTTWTEQAKLRTSDLATYDVVGTSVHIDDAANYVAIGAPGEGRQNNFTTSGLGAVYIFNRSGTTWTEQQKLTSTNVSPINNGGQLGHSVYLEAGANFVVAGAQTADKSGVSSTGAVYVFTRSGTTWTQAAQLIGTQETGNSAMFGSAVAINKKGTVMAVGAKSDDTQSSGGGAVYIFDRLTSAQTWTQRAKMYHFKSSGNSRGNDLLGETIAIDNAGTTLFTGAYGNDDQSLAGGSVYFFTNTFATTTASGLSRPRGSVIEEVSGICDGRTVISESGVYTMPNVTAVLNLTTSYQALTGSELTYFAPVGTKRVKYQLEVKLKASGYSGISHYKLFVDDVEVTKFRTTRNYSYSSSNQGNLYESFVWVFDCDGTADAATGTFDGWVGGKTIRMTAREYNSSYQMQLHNNTWWDGSGASGTEQLGEPILTITAYA